MSSNASVINFRPNLSSTSRGARTIRSWIRTCVSCRTVSYDAGTVHDVTTDMGTKFLKWMKAVEFTKSDKGCVNAQWILCYFSTRTEAKSLNAPWGSF